MTYWETPGFRPSMRSIADTLHNALGCGFFIVQLEHPDGWRVAFFGDQLEIQLARRDGRWLVIVGADVVATADDLNAICVEIRKMRDGGAK